MAPSIQHFVVNSSRHIDDFMENLDKDAQAIITKFYTLLSNSNLGVCRRHNTLSQRQPLLKLIRFDIVVVMDTVTYSRPKIWKTTKSIKNAGVLMSATRPECPNGAFSINSIP
jgi:uncharacterized protein involved in propanediol utilization